MLNKIKRRLITRKIINPSSDVDETSCVLVSSRGLLKSCDYYPRYPRSGFEKVRDIPAHRIKDRSILYVQNSAISDFYKQYFPKINKSFVLVSGDSDHTMPFDQLSDYEFQNLLNDGRCLHWFSQNALPFQHTNFSIIPAGLDYHTLTYSHRRHSWGDWCLPVDQEKKLISIRDCAFPTSQRKLMGYSTFHFFMTGRYGYDRVDAIVNIPKGSVFYERVPVDRETTWKNQSEYAYVVSPLTNGLDAHRTWEALALGCIPIVKKSPIIQLFDELPVLILDQWEDLTLEKMTLFLKEVEYKRHLYNFDKLKLKFWTDKIRLAARK